MRGRKPRAVPLKTAKLGVDTIMMLRDVAGAYRTLDQAVWVLAEGFRTFLALRVEERSAGNGSSVPEALREKYSAPRDRQAYSVHREPTSTKTVHRSDRLGTPEIASDRKPGRRRG